jgi:phage FluMu gp28-like protein
VPGASKAKKNYSLHKTTFDEALAQGLYKRICLIKGEAWSPGKQDTWREEIIASYGDGADKVFFALDKY